MTAAMVQDSHAKWTARSFSSKHLPLLFSPALASYIIWSSESTSDATLYRARTSSTFIMTQKHTSVFKTNSGFRLWLELLLSTLICVFDSLVSV